MVPDLSKSVPNGPKMTQNVGRDRTITKHFGLSHFSNFSIGLRKVFANHIYQILGNFFLRIVEKMVPALSNSVPMVPIWLKIFVGTRPFQNTLVYAVLVVQLVFHRLQHTCHENRVFIGPKWSHLS